MRTDNEINCFYPTFLVFVINFAFVDFEANSSLSNDWNSAEPKLVFN